MRKPFVSLIANDRYQIGCTGQTVYILDTVGNELSKFKDMTYAYYPALHPDGEIAAVFSNKGIMAVYSLSECRLIRKFRVSAENDTQTDSVPCFSPDGKYLYHVEGRKGDGLDSRISVYETAEYQPVMRLFEQGEKTVFDGMEFDRNSGLLFLLGYFRKVNRNDCFVAQLRGQSLQNVRILDKHIYDFYQGAIRLKQTGFTKESYKWSIFTIKSKLKVDMERTIGHPADFGPFNQEYTLDDLKQMDLSLAQLWEEGTLPKKKTI